MSCQYTKPASYSSTTDKNLKALPTPNYTQVPNQVLDEWMPHLSGNEFKIVCVIVRKTTGWHKEWDSLSISLLSRLTGISESSVKECTKSLVDQGFVQKMVKGPNGSASASYRLLFKTFSTQPKSDQVPSQKLATPPSQNLATQKKELNKLKESDATRARNATWQELFEVLEEVEHVREFDHVPGSEMSEVIRAFRSIKKRDPTFKAEGPQFIQHLLKKVRQQPSAELPPVREPGAVAFQENCALWTEAKRRLEGLRLGLGLDAEMFECTHEATFAFVAQGGVSFPDPMNLDQSAPAFRAELRKRCGAFARHVPGLR